LPDVDAVSLHQARDVGAIVDDDLRALRVRRRDDPISQRRQARARIVLGAKLQQSGAAAQTRFDQRNRVIPPIAADGGIDDWVDDGGILDLRTYGSGLKAQAKMP
jgi:hypothetical protein